MAVGMIFVAKDFTHALDFRPRDPRFGCRKGVRETARCLGDNLNRTLGRVPHHPVFPEPNEAKSLGGKFDPDNGLEKLLQDGGTLSLHSEDPDGFFFDSSP
jgi:hypothetical protein